MWLVAPILGAQFATRHFHLLGGMVLLEYQAMSSLREVAQNGVLCTFRKISATYRASTIVWSVKQAAWTVYHVQNQTLPGQSPPASQAGVGPAF